jgi:hypothetical protein
VGRAIEGNESGAKHVLSLAELRSRPHQKPATCKLLVHACPVGRCRHGLTIKASEPLRTAAIAPPSPLEAC